MKPGEALYYASTWTEGDFPYGMLIKTIDGRPINITGNPKHPVNGQASNAQMQAMCMTLYDPERLREPLWYGKPILWAEADKRVVAALREAKSVALITRSTLGPSERALIKKFQEIKPGTRHLVLELVHDAPRRTTWQKVYGGDGEAVPRYDRAKVILSLDCDFLLTDGAALEAIHQYASTRAPELEGAEMSRLYVVEGGMTLTGANADHRIALRPSLIERLAAVLLAALKSEDETPLMTFAKEQKLTQSF